MADYVYKEQVFGPLPEHAPQGSRLARGSDKEDRLAAADVFPALRQYSRNGTLHIFGAFQPGNSRLVFYPYVTNRKPA